jgi:hypothetical protein
MAYSSFEGKDATAQFIKDNDIKTVLDVGAGSGTYYHVVLENSIVLDKFDAVEVWEPYVNQFDLKSKYHNVFVSDVRSWENFSYDLVILGDILEHMTKPDAIKVWESVSKQANSAIISIPIIHYPQGHEDGNPYEEHIKDDWTTEEVLGSFSDIVEYREYDVVGVFYAKFK